MSAYMVAEEVDEADVEENGHIHDWQYQQKHKSVGPNIFGKIVVCWGWDIVCASCGAVTWMKARDKAE